MSPSNRPRQSLIAAAIRLALAAAAPTIGFAADLPIPADAWVSLGAATKALQGTNLTIHQTTDKAILNWKSFNVGRGHSVEFQQPGTQSIALNRIDPAAEPSRILGTISANGQVYLVNPNGFVFGKESRVDTNALVVSTLDISRDTLEKGLTKVIDQDARTPVAALTATSGAYRTGANGAAERIKVGIEDGAVLSSNADGGRILIAAPSIENRGTITAPGGQVVLAAATDKVYLAEADSRSDLRGILVEVGTGGDIRNLGTLKADRGNVTAIGYAVYQQGRVSASTSVNLNGSIRLLAREGAKVALDSTTGRVRLAPASTVRAADSGDGLGTQAAVLLDSGSRTVVDLDASAGTAVDEQPQARLNVRIEAGRIRLEADSLIQAKGGKLALIAAARPDAPLSGGTQADNNSRIELAPGAKIDVSGTRDTVLPMSRNLLKVELRTNELRDAPVQKGGVLKNKVIQVDLRQGTKLADVSGALARITRTVSERNSNGGDVSLSSEGSVAIEAGAAIDVSGGLLRFLGGRIETTKLWSGGRVYDIADADPNRHYDAVLGFFTKTFERWNVTHTWALNGPTVAGRFEPGYVEGKSAGTVTIQSRDLSLNGTVNGEALQGPYQREAAARPSGGSVAIDLAWSGLRQPEIRLAGASASNPAPSETTPPPILLTDRWFAAGLRRVSLSTAGRITGSPEVSLNLPVDGELLLTGGEIDVAGAIRAPSGLISLHTTAATTNGAEPLSGTIHLGTSSGLDVSGLWVNDRFGGAPDLSVPLAIDGGSISLHAFGDLLLDPGSKLATAGGAWLDSAGTVHGGKGGDLTLASAGKRATELRLGADINGRALEHGGRLAIGANAIRIADSASVDAGVLTITPRLLADAGFADIALTANGGALTVASGTRVTLAGRNAALNERASAARSGSSIQTLTQPVLQSELFRNPVNLALSVEHDGAVGRYSAVDRLTVETGAEIEADPQARISLSADSGIAIDGTVFAPAGSIAVNLFPVTSVLDRGYDPAQAIALGPSARLLTPGATLLEPAAMGLRSGTVADGGTVSLTASRGYLLLDRDARVDVSGTAGWLDIAGGKPGGNGFNRTRIGSDGGSIALTAAEGMVLDGQLLAQAGQGPGTAGGSLSIALDANGRGLATENLPTDAQPIPTAPRVIHLTDPTMPSLAPGEAVLVQNRDRFQGQARLASATVAAGGFANLSLKTTVTLPGDGGALADVPSAGAIQFDGDVHLKLADTLTLDTPVLRWNPTADAPAGSVQLGAGRLTLGSTLNRTGPGAVTSGSGTLTVDAGWIDLIGGMDTQGFGQLNLRSREDIRLIGINPGQELDDRGRFASGGDLTLAARQLYPSTRSDFSILVDAVTAPSGRLAIEPTGTAGSVPLSAGGSLTLDAPDIVSAGTIRAPFGTIALNATRALTLAGGSLTSVSAEGRVIPFGRTQGGLDWIFPRSAGEPVYTGAPAKRILLNGESVAIASGAAVDLSGGGDLHAFEFIAGPGGSVDRLDAANAPDTYAILPTLGSSNAPYDPLDWAASGLRMGESLHLAGGVGLPAGDYVLLPAHYGLLPGAYLVTAEAKTTDFAPGTPATRVDGVPLIAGFRMTSGTNHRDPRWSGYAVEPGAAARTRSEYQESLASAFFAKSTAATQTRDAGTLQIAASRAIDLSGSVTALAASGGRRGQLDLAARSLLLVADAAAAAANTTADTVAINAEGLSRLDIDSILIGGTRREDAGTTRLTITADRVAVAPATTVTAPELILAANQSVTVGDGAVLRASGDTGDGSQADLVTGNRGAVLRVSSHPETLLQRSDDGQPVGGDLWVDAGSVLSGRGLIELNAPGSARLDGAIAPQTGTLALSAAAISLGDAPDASKGLVLSEQDINALQVDRLVLASRSRIDLYGDLTIRAKSLELQSAGLSGFGAQNETARIVADTIRVGNAASAAGASDVDGLSSLSLEAARIELTDGAVALSGFAEVALLGTDAIVGQGEAQLTTTGNLSLTAGKLTATAGADLLIDAGAHAVTIASAANGRPDSVTPGLAAALTVEAGSLRQSGRVELPSGSVTYRSAGSIDLDAGALIDVAGRTVDLGANLRDAPGGSILLHSDTANVSLAERAAISLAGAAGGGAAGSFAVEASSGRIALAGAVDGHSAGGNAGGSLRVDQREFAGGFAAFARLAASGGFDHSLGYRQRSGDLVIDRNTTLAADQIRVTADQGDLELTGTLDASGSTGGSVALAAGRDLTLGSTARISAAATTAGGTGGSVELSAIPADAAHAGRIDVQGGASIDVSGGAGGRPGSVHLRAMQLAGNDVAASIAPGVVIGDAAGMIVEAVAIESAADYSNAGIADWRQATAAFMEQAGANAGLNTRLGGFTLAPGIEIRAAGDFDLGLAEKLAKAASWTRVGTSNVWSAPIGSISGTIAQKSADGTVRLLTAAANRTLTRDGSYFLDQDPKSASFGQVFLRVFPDTAQTGANRYDPRLIRDTVDFGTAQSRYWARVGATNVWSIRLAEIAGAPTTLTQIAPDGSVRTLTAATSPTLGKDGTFFFDADPQSPTYRQLSVQVFADTTLTGVNRYNPDAIRAGLRETNGWDFALTGADGSTWRFGPEQVPGFLSVRAGGNLTVGATLSDGFVQRNADSLATFFGLAETPSWLPTLMLQDVASWSFRLVAGADAMAADANATLPRPSAVDQGRLQVAAGSQIRTGTGAIELRAAGDIRLADETSAIYTGGRPDAADRYGSFGATQIVNKGFFAEYPTGGGDIRLSAGGDIVGAATSQFLSDWLVRTGSWNLADGIDAKDRPTAWGIAFDNLVIRNTPNEKVQNLKFGFRQNVGALGGGSIAIDAGGDLRDLQAVIPSSGKPVGAIDPDGQIVENRIDIRGGGSLSVRAGGDIAGGLFYVDRGSADIAASGAVTGGSQYRAGPVVSVGDANLSIKAGRGIALGTALNPFAVKAAKYTDKTAYFTTYTSGAGLTLMAIAGDIVLNNDTSFIQNAYKVFDAATPNGGKVLNAAELLPLTLYPGTLKANALSGNLKLLASFDLFPSPAGDLELLAAGDIVLGDDNAVVINQSDADPASVLPLLAPTSSLNDVTARLDIFKQYNADLLHAATPLHATDTRPVVVAAAGGDITAAPGSFISTAEPADIDAALDIVGLGLKLQNLRANDVSIVRSGRDLRFPIVRNPLNGELDTHNDTLPIQLGGPGALRIIAGRDVDLGTSAGIATVGNLINPNLPAGGAAITVMAGSPATTNPRGDVSAVATQTLPEFRPAIARWMLERTGAPSLDEADAFSAFYALPLGQRYEFTLALLFESLQKLGQDAAKLDQSERGAYYLAAEQAITKLFPSPTGAGDIRLFFSRIQTLDGGDIRLLAPWGGIDVGLASAFRGNKTEDQLGVIAQREGSISALARNDFAVNQSRVFTLDGGDITVWAREGNIDAGRGAKAALSVPPPTTGFDAKGNLIVTFPPIVSGSGIRAQNGRYASGVGSTGRQPAVTDPYFDDALAAEVTLVAPQGVIDAGEAGIFGGDVALAGAAIRSADNISAANSVTGTPAAAVSYAGGLAGANAAAAGSTTAAQAVDQTREATRATETASRKPPVVQNRITAELVGFGDCSVGDIRKGSEACR